jgi:hypothetical protein
MKKQHKKEELICEHKPRVGKDGNWYGFGRRATLRRSRGSFSVAPVAVPGAGRCVVHQCPVK